MTTTTNLGLKKPDKSEFYTVDIFNDNSDKIDGAIGTANGIASLDASGKVPSAQLPSFDDINNAIGQLINIWDGEYESGYIDVATGRNATGSDYARNNGYIKVTPNTQYHSYCNGANPCTILFYTEGLQYISYANGKDVNFTTPSTCAYIRFCVDGAKVENVSINYPSSYTEYYPNKAKSTELLDIKVLGWSVPKEVGVDNYMDSSRVFHQKVSRVNLGSLLWNTYSGVYFISEQVNEISASGRFYSHINSGSPDVDGYVTITSQKAILVRGESYSGDIDAFKSAMQGVYLYYELANEKTFNVDGSEIGSDIACLGSAMVRGKWNQLVYIPSFSGTHHGITFSYGGNGVVKANGTSDSNYAYLKICEIEVVANHKYYINPNRKEQINTIYQLQINDGLGAQLQYYFDRPRIQTAKTNTFVLYFNVRPNSTVSNETMQPVVIDLTEIFGAGNEPTSAEHFRKMFTEDYYPYRSIDGVLWENASPTSSFSAQTLNDINMSAFDHLEVICKVDSSTNVYSTNIVQIDNTANEIYMAYNSYYYHRSVTANTTAKTITFGSGYRSSSSGTTYMIPIKVIGVRK